MRVAIANQEPLDTHSLSRKAIANNDDPPLPMIHQASAPNHPLIKNQLSDVRFGAHQCSNGLSRDAQNTATSDGATVEQGRAVVQQIEFAGELQLGQGGFHLARGSSFSFVELQFALLHNKKVHQPLSLLEKVAPRLDRLWGTVTSQTPHHGWGHTFRFARRL